MSIFTGLLNIHFWELFQLIQDIWHQELASKDMPDGIEIIWVTQGSHIRSCSLSLGTWAKCIWSVTLRTAEDWDEVFEEEDIPQIVEAYDKLRKSLSKNKSEKDRIAQKVHAALQAKGYRKE